MRKKAGGASVESQMVEPKPFVYRRADDEGYVYVSYIDFPMFRLNDKLVKQYGKRYLNRCLEILANNIALKLLKRVEEIDYQQDVVIRPYKLESVKDG